MVDWGSAIQTGAVGFGLVFSVLILLALAVWVTGQIVKRLSPTKPHAKESKKT